MPNMKESPVKFGEVKMKDGKKNFIKIKQIKN